MTFPVFRFIILILLSSSQIRQNSAKTLVVGGQKAKDIRDYPYVVSIHYDDGNRCGGTILSKWYVLTAAHCLKTSGKIDYIRAGSSLFDKGGSTHQAVRNMSHTDRDIGVIRVKQPFSLNDTRQAVKLFDQDEDPKVGVEGVVIGWGKTQEFGGYPMELQFVDVPIINRRMCNDVYNRTRLGAIKDDQICAGHAIIGGKDACQGDSGGPLMVGERQAGIVSFGIGCARPEYPGVYTSVGYFRDWIRKNTGV